jgi:hypothetical protein
MIVSTAFVYLSVICCPMLERHIAARLIAALVPALARAMALAAPVMEQ